MKNLNTLTEKEYKSLDKAGMLYVLYPEATGDYKSDTKKEVLTGELYKQYVSTHVQIVTDMWLSVGGNIQYYPAGSLIVCGKDVEIRSATTLEIEAELITQAKKNGFVYGAKFKDVDIANATWTISTSHVKFSYNEEDDRLRAFVEGMVSGAYITIYDKGKWAEIVKEQPIKIGGHEVKFKSGRINIGCTGFDNYTVKAFAELTALCANRGISIEIDKKGRVMYNLIDTYNEKEHYSITKDTLDDIDNKLID